MPTGVKGNALTTLTAPIVGSDYKPIIRGTQTYKAPALDTPILCAVSNVGNLFRSAASDDPTGSWKLGIPAPDASGSIQQWGGLIWNDDLKLFFASSLFGSNGQNDIMSSPDGVNWWGGLVPTGFNFQQLAYASSISTIVAVSSVGPTTTARVVTSTDGGKTWTTRSLPTASVTLLGVAWSPTLNLFAAMGSSNAVFTSPDGITWTSRTGPTTSHGWKLGTWCGGTINKFVFGSFDGGTSAMCYSSDGITWTNGSAASGLNVPDGIAYSSDLDMVIIVDGNGEAILWSTNGTSFTRINTGFGSVPLHGITWSHTLGLWVITSASGMNYTSPDGTTWTARQPPSFQTWNRVAASR